MSDDTDVWGGPIDFKPIQYRPSDIKFTFTSAALEAAQLALSLEPYARALERELLRRLNDELSRTCSAGHLHRTYQGRVFCDEMTRG